MRKLIKLFEDGGGHFCSAEIGDISDSDFEREKLVYDSKTKVVYYKFYEYVDADSAHVGYMSPYISENGKFCRFIDNKIVEIG